MERDDDLAAREEREAAAEAGRIGGDAGTAEDLDPADRPLAEAGQGYAEGFEVAEDDLVRNASHDDGTGDPAADAFTGETEADASGAVYGEPDEID